MAVNIPVVIDIDGAFNEAAKRVSVAMKPLQKAIDDNTANIKLTTGKEWNDLLQMMVPVRKTLGDIIGLQAKVNKKTGATTYSLASSTEELAIALADARDQYSRLSAMQEKGLSVDYKKLDAYRESITVLMSEINLRQRNVQMVERATQAEINKTAAIDAGNYALIQEANTMSEITAKITALRGKLQNLDPKDKEWHQTAMEIKKATAELAKYEERLQATLTPLKGGAGSVDRISADMQQVINKWNAMSQNVKFDANGQLSKKAIDLINKYKQLTAQSEKFGRSIDSYVQKSIKGHKSILSSLNSVTAAFGVYMSSYQLVRFVKQIRDVTGELEYQRVALGHLIQDVDYGNHLFGRIIEAAKQSPFRINQLTTYVKQLAAYRIEEENLFDTTRRLADISAGLGVSMDRLILAYGQVRAASVLRGQELRQFTEAGIPLVELLAEKFTELNGKATTTGEVFRKISDRAVPFSMIADIFEDLTDKGGMFYNMQEEQAKTLKGRWEKLKDAYDQALMRLGENDTFQKWNDIVLSILNGVANNLTGIIKILNAASIAWVAYWTATKSGLGTMTQLIFMFVRTHGLLGALKVALGSLTVSFKKLWAAISTSWVGLALAAIAGLVTYLTTFKKQVDRVNLAVEELTKSAEELHEANSKHDRLDTLITRYQKLAEKTERSSAENEKLEKLITRLQDEFPDLSSAIDGQTASLEENVKKLREKNDAELEAEKIDKRRDLETKQNQLNERVKELETIKNLKSFAQEDYNEAIANRDAIKESIEAGNGVLNYLFNSKKALKVAEKAVKENDSELNNLSSRYETVKQEVDGLTNAIERLKRELDGVPTEDVTAGWETWKKKVYDLQDAMTELGDVPVFTLEELNAINSVYDLFKKLKKQVKDLEESLKGMRAQLSKMTPQDAGFENLSKEIADKQKTLEIAQAIAAMFNFDFSSKSGQYKKPAYITQMENQIKFMKDFKKGYDELSKYLTKGQAKQKEAGYMLGRGLSLGLDSNTQQEAAEGLSNWYQKQINAVIDEMKRKGLKTGTLTEILGRQITGDKNKDKLARDYQALLQSLWDAKTDFDTSEAEKSIDKALKQIEDNTKKSETARNFYKDILDLTGDADLATSLAVSIYGEPGADFKDRMQRELYNALTTLDPVQADLKNDLLGALTVNDFDFIEKNLEKLPPKVKAVFEKMLEENRKYDANIAKDYAKLLMKFDEIEQQRVNISQKAAQDMANIESGLQLELKALREKGASEAEQQAAKDRAELAQGAVDREAKLQLSRLEADYRIFFSSVGVISEKAARKIAEAQKVALTDQFVRGEISLAKYKRELKELDEQLQKYKGWDMLENFLSGKWGTVLSEQLSNYSDGLLAIASTLETKNGFWSPNESTKKFLKEIDRVLNFGNFAAIFKKGAKISIEDQANAAAKKAYNDAKLRGKSEKMANKAAAEAAGQTLAKAAEKAQKAQAILMDMTNAFAIIVRTFGSFADMVEGYEDDIMRSTGDYSTRANKVVLNFNGVEQELNITGRQLTSAISSIATAWDKIKNMDLYGGMRELYLGFSGINAQVKTANEDIQIQSRRIKDLEYAYNRLGVALEESFGSDYIANYNQQLVVLRAQAEAYRKQAEAERSKGKKADEETARGYEDSAKQVEDTIKDMMDQVSEFMSGTNLTSAAREFAQAWIEAYKEFGSTTDAMKEKFNDMIENMVVNSLAARLIQSILKPVFDAIDTASADGALTAEDVAATSKMVPERLAMINGSMNTLMNQLTAAGSNLRGMTGGFTGISRDIAGASEESINGLAAGINTQNFYMQHIDMNVAAILAALTGGTTTAQSGTTGEYVDPYKDSMLRYAGSLDEKLGLLLDAFNSVVTLNGTKRAIQVNM